MHASTEVRAPVSVIVARLSDRRDALTRAMVERYQDEIADYRLADEEFLHEDVQDVTAANLDAVLRSMLGDDAAAEQTIAQTGERAARRVRQGVSLDAFLHAARLFGQTLWESVLEEVDPSIPGSEAAALEIAACVMRHVDRMSTAAAQGYLNEVQSLWTDREVVHRDLLEDLISGRGDPERVRDLARSLRLTLADRYVVVIARGRQIPTEEAPDQSIAARAALRRIVESARRKLSPAIPCLLVGMRHGEVVALYPVSGPQDSERVAGDAAELANQLTDYEIYVGIGGNRPGLGSITTSYLEARDAVEIAWRSAVPGRVVSFDDVLLDQIARSSPHADRIIESILQPLLDHDRRKQADLIGTLRAYAQAGLSLTRAAELLNVHPNTVVYRLRRIHELSGRDPHQVDDLLLLHFALRLLALRPELGRSDNQPL